MERRNYWYLNLLGMLASGLFIGYERQVTADSGDRFLDKILVSMFIADGSYLLAFLLFPKRETVYKVPSWVLMAVLGSAICFLNLHVIKYSIDNWGYRKSDSVIEYMVDHLPDMGMGFLIITPIYSFVAFFIMGGIRLAVALFKSLRGV
jgi:hypothetical protein